MSQEQAGFQEALDAALPILQGMKKSLRKQPSATHASLERLSAVDPVKYPPAPAAPAAPRILSTPTDDGRLSRLEELKGRILACTRCPNPVSYTHLRAHET
jgi:hypothetical protein